MVHILIIDDRRDDRLLAAREIERAIADVTITEIASAEGFARALAAVDFDLAIVDYQLRWGDGIGLLRAIKARRPNCPVVMFSATASAENAVMAMKEGLDDYVLKSPRHYARLAIAVRAALDRAAARQRITALEAEQAEALAREQAARQEAERARERLAFLVEAGVLFSSSLDYPTTLQQAANLAVPRLGDWCTVELLTEDGQLRRMAIAHVDPAKLDPANELYRRYPPNPSARGGVWQVVRTGEPLLYPTIGDDVLQALAYNPEHLALLRAAGMRAGISVPLFARGQVLGALTLAMAESGRNYGEEDLELAMALARRAALAIDSAQLYAAEQRARVSAEQLADRLSRLQAVMGALAAALQPEDVARAVTEQCVQALSAKASAVMTFDPASRALRLLHETGYGASFREWASFSADEPYPFGEVVRSATPLYLDSRAAFNARYPELARYPAVTEAVAYLPLVADGQVLGGLSVGFAAPRELQSDERTFLEALASQCAQALDRARLYTAEQRARDRLAFLAEASSSLIASLDYQATLQQISRLCVPRLADWCVVDRPAEDGTLVMEIVTHIDPAKEQWAREMRERVTVYLDQPVGASQVIRTGEPLLLPHITDELLQAAARDEEELRLLRLIGYRSMIVVPLRAQDRIIGSLGLVTTTESGRQYSADDVALAEELARRAGVALENARLYAEAQSAIRARDQFLTVASHELKTPLTGLLGHAELLTRRLGRAGGADQRTERSLQTIAAQAQRLSRLVTTLLDLARVQNDQLRLNLELLDLRPLAQQVVAELHGLLEQQRIVLAVPAEPVRVHGDALRLEQVLVNILQNAIKYSPAGSPIAMELAQGPAGAALMVRDEGIGIPAAARPHLFSRFYRAPNVDVQHISGMGMGLFLVHEIVARHGGAVEVASEEGRGTTITIRLPSAPESELEKVPALAGSSSLALAGPTHAPALQAEQAAPGPELTL